MEIEKPRSSLREIENKKQLNRIRFDLDNFPKIIVCYFYAKWHQ